MCNNGNVPVYTKPHPNDRTKLLKDLEVGSEMKVDLDKRRLGFIALFGVICTNILQAESVQWLQGPINFQKPFFIMCFSHAAPVVMLPLMLVYYRIYGSPEDKQSGFDFRRVFERHSVIPFSRLVRLSAFFGVFYLVSDYFWFSSFKNLTVATGAAIFNSQPLFVYCFSICLLSEKASIKRLCGVVTAFVGVVMVVMNQGGGDSDREAGGSSIVAAMMMLTAAAMSAMFSVSLSKFVGNDMNDIPTLFTFSGFCGLFAFPPWIIGTIFFANSPIPSLYEEVGFPTTEEGILALTAAIVFFVINFVCLSPAICWTSPLETSVGFMLTIPLSGVMDTLIHHASFSWEFIVGSGLVMAGFAILELKSTKLLAQCS
ncbi:hypothetical protein F443_11615 [Phytophthora nicotianae P1569]|uniref:EamA domain-containing protein n=1 Tax=Phytophthora nicotianae P1569 TaxID=1317065 RepID=V9EVY9_PHYNI|nr:hypothetical protein F443_11615 [Phytophthora nicotianae P1569]